MQNRLKLAAYAVAAVSLWGVNCARAADMAADTDRIKMNACLAMTSDARIKDTECTDLMKRMNISESDMNTIKSCKAMKQDIMMSDKTCSAMIAAHPDVMKPQSPQ